MSNTRPYGEMKPFVEAIERKYPEIELDYKSPRKERHWSWYLIPLTLTPGKIPRVGTEIFYFHDNDEVIHYLTYAPLRKYYKEFLDVLHHVVYEGTKEGMTTSQALNYYLQPIDYDKFVKHLELFAPIANELGDTEIVRLYRILAGIEAPDTFNEPRCPPPPPRPPRPPMPFPFPPRKIGKGLWNPKKYYW